MTPDEKHLQLLMTVFGFDLEDLQSNALGKLTPRQLKQVSEHGKLLDSLLRALFILNFLLICLHLLGNLGYLLFLSRSGYNLICSGFSICCSGVVLVVLGFTIYARHTVKQEIQIIKGAAVLGQSLLVIPSVWLGENHYHLNKKQFYALKNGEHYQVHVVRHQILSICPLDYAEQLPHVILPQFDQKDKQVSK